MNPLRFIIIWFLCAAMLPACNSPVEYEIPTARPQLVVNSLFGRDSTWRIEISTTATTGQLTEIESLKDAKVYLTENGMQISDLHVDSAYASPEVLRTSDQDGETKLYYHYTVNTRARIGSSYGITVSHPGYETAYSSSAIPVSQTLRQEADPSPGSIQLNGKEYREVKIEIADDGNTNYYALELTAKGRGADGPAKIGFYSREPVLRENFSSGVVLLQNGVFFNPTGGVYFENSDFRGGDKLLSIYIDADYLSTNFKLKFRLLSLSEEFYRFATSYQRQLLNSGNPFAEPSPVFSNVVNGLGIFAGYSVRELSVR